MGMAAPGGAGSTGLGQALPALRQEGAARAGTHLARGAPDAAAAPEPNPLVLQRSPSRAALLCWSSCPSPLWGRHRGGRGSCDTSLPQKGLLVLLQLRLLPAARGRSTQLCLSLVLQLIEDLRKQLEHLQLFKLEAEQRRGRSSSMGLQEYNSRTRETELEQEIKQLKQVGREVAWLLHLPPGSGGLGALSQGAAHGSSSPSACFPPALGWESMALPEGQQEHSRALSAVSLGLPGMSHLSRGFAGSAGAVSGDPVQFPALCVLLVRVECPGLPPSDMLRGHHMLQQRLLCC